MAREHTPIQIGLPPEAAWEMAQPATTQYIAFVAGDEMPDPGDAFIAAGESFGVAPQQVAPMPVEAEVVAWAFEFRVPSRGERLMLWCERVEEGQTPDRQVTDARWAIFIESVLEPSRPVEDAVALAATVARAGGARTRLVFTPDLALIFNAEDVRRLFLASPPGQLLDERHLYRIEVVAKDRANGPYWLSTVGFWRIGRPELEMLEIPAEELRPALELLDALASRLATEPLPGAGVPFEAGVDLRIALVPAAEAAETLDAGMPGSLEDRKRLARGPRAAVCAAGKRGSFRAVWMPPHDELQAIARGERALFLAPRVVEVRERRARAEWGAFVASFAEHGAGGARAHYAKVAVANSDANSGDGVEHMWIEVESADANGVRGVADRGETDGPDGRPSASRAASQIACPMDRVGDWLVRGVIVPGYPTPVDATPESASILR